MASRWMREITFEYNGGSYHYFYQKAYALFLRYVCDFTFQSESVGAGRSWVSTEKNGTNGAFSGSDYNFTDVTASAFASTDVGKWLIVNDSTNPENGGIYKIVGFTSASVIKIDFVAGYQEYPLAGSGISWWLLGSTYQLPTADNEYVRLQSRHSTGWAIQIRRCGWPFYAIAFTVAPNGNWGDKIIGKFTGAIQEREPFGFYQTWGNGSGRGTFWCECDYDGEWLHLWQCSLDGGGFSNDANIHQVSVERMVPIEAGLTDDELIALWGQRIETPAYQNWGFRAYEGSFCRTRSWSNFVGDEVAGYTFDYSLGDYTYGWVRQPIRGPNWRRDGKWEAFRGTPIVVDELNYSGNYHFKAYLNGHWSIPMLGTNQGGGQLLAHGASNRTIKKMTILNMGGSRNRLLIDDGTVVPWCGWSIINQGRP